MKYLTCLLEDNVRAVHILSSHYFSVICMLIGGCASLYLVLQFFTLIMFLLYVIYV
jgi:hypothetical protein